MKEETKGSLLYGAVVAFTLTAAFGIAVSGAFSHAHNKITVEPAAHQITQKQDKFLTVPYYSDVQSKTTVFNLDARTKTVTDNHTETAGIMVNDKGHEAQTSPITQADLDSLRQQSPEAAKLIRSLNL
jgi:hypothetical protein